MKKSRGRILLPLFVLILSLILVFIARAYAPASRLMRDIDAAQALSRTDAAQLEPLVAQTARDYRELRDVLAPVASIAPLFGWLPFFGGDLANANALLELGDHFIVGAEHALPLLRALDSQDAPLTVLVNIANTQKNILAQSRRDYSQAVQTRARIDATKLSPYARRFIEPIDGALTLWRIALDAVDIAPAQFGGDKPRTFLLLAQNSDELRPTGGFITTVALLRIQRGEISVTDFQDSYNVDDYRRFHPQPPPALTKYMFAGMLVLRDANWFPDFPSSARAAQNIYRVDRGITTDGVIAVNLKMLPRILDAFESVTVEPGSERVDAGNAMDKIRTYWAPPAQSKAPLPDWWIRRKDFIGQLLDAIIKRLKSGDFSRVKFASALGDSIAAKDLLIYFKDADETQQSKFVWSGTLSNELGDVLMVVDSNVGFNKLDSNVERRIEYVVNVDAEGAARSVVTITYKNYSPPDGKPCELQVLYPPVYAALQQGCYWDYVRVITPAGSRLISTDGVQDAITEPPSISNRTTFAGYLVLPRGETRTVRFEYAVPPQAELKSNYVLTLEKQPGAPNIPVQVRVQMPGRWAQDYSLTLDRTQKISTDADPEFGLWLIVLGALAGIGMIAGGLRLGRNSKR